MKSSQDEVIVDEGEPSPNGWCVFIREKFGHRGETRGKCEGRVRNWSDASTSQGIPRIVGNTRIWERGTKWVLP